MVSAKRGSVEVQAFGRTLEKARANVTTAIATKIGIYPGDVVIRDDIELADRAEHRLSVAREARNALIAAGNASREATSAAVAALLKEDLSMRDCAYLLGISHSRVQQIIEELERGGKG
jgi:hypothetical protein